MWTTGAILRGRIRAVVSDLAGLFRRRRLSQPAPAGPFDAALGDLNRRPEGAEAARAAYDLAAGALGLAEDDADGRRGLARATLQLAGEEGFRSPENLAALAVEWRR